MRLALARTFAALWPVALACYWAFIWGLASGSGFTTVTGWDGFALSALGLVIALFLLAWVDQIVALTPWGRSRPYAHLVGTFQLPASLRPWAWLIAPSGVIVGFVIGWRAW